MNFETTKFAGALPHCLFVFIIVHYGLTAGLIIERKTDVVREMGAGDEEERVCFDTAGVNLVISEGL